MEFSRRRFIKALGLGTIASCVPAQLLHAERMSSPEIPDLRRTRLPSLGCDVIVVGAGPSGIPAAMAAARMGAKVILLEEDMIIGGATTDMYVTYMCGAPRTGVYLDVVQELNRNHSLGGKPSGTLGEWAWDGKNHWWLPSSYSQVWNDMVGRYDNLQVMCGASVVDVAVKSKGSRNVVKGVYVSRGGKLQFIGAPVTIDATGTGLVSMKAGCEYYYGSDSKSDFNESIGMEKSDGRVQPCTQMFISQRIKRDARFPRGVFNTGVLDNDDKLWATQQSDEYFESKDSGVFLHWGATVECKDTTDPVEVAVAQAKALEKLKPQLKALHKAGYATHLAPKIGVRESRRVRGEYVITVDDILNGVMPDDIVADAWYSLDPWGIKLDEKMRNSVGPYGIPYRALIPYSTEGLLTAGRIISGTRLAMSSYRVQPICGTIGEAAGTAAAMASMSKTGVRDIDVRQLQRTLDSFGLFDWYGKVGMNVNNKVWK